MSHMFFLLILQMDLQCTEKKHKSSLLSTHLSETFSSMTLVDCDSADGSYIVKGKQRMQDLIQVDFFQFFGENRHV